MKSKAFDWKGFLKPNGMKLLLFLLIFLVFPFPADFYFDYETPEWNLIPFSGFTGISAVMLTILLGFQGYESINLLVIFYVTIFLLFSYLLSILIIFVERRLKPKGAKK